MKFSEKLIEFCKNGAKVLKNQRNQSGAVQRKMCQARRTLKNEALDAKIGVDTAENEPRKGSEKCIL